MGKAYHEKNNYNTRKRLFALLILIIVLFTAVFAKLAYVMIWQNKELQVKALGQWLRDVPNDAPRGQILDRNQDIIADTSTLYTIYVRPNAVDDKISVAKTISSVLGIEYQAVMKKII